MSLIFRPRVFMTLPSLLRRPCDGPARSVVPIRTPETENWLKELLPQSTCENIQDVRILVVDDDPRVLRLLVRGLLEEGHVVERAADGAKALETMMSAEFDVIVLDVMLPAVTGVEVVQRMRAEGHRTPVLMLTARDANADVVKGLNAGADDYLTKPFSFEVLLARINALARRGPSVLESPLRVADLSLDTTAHKASRNGTALPLTRTEFSLLEYLMRRTGRVVTRRALIEGVWGTSRDVEDNTLEAFVKLLRHKLDQGGGAPLIQTVRGVGYTIRGDRD
jgi:two-component system response regulator MprA